MKPIRGISGVRTDAERLRKERLFSLSPKPTFKDETATNGINFNAWQLIYDIRGIVHSGSEFATF